MYINLKKNTVCENRSQVYAKELPSLHFSVAQVRLSC